MKFSFKIIFKLWRQTHIWVQELLNSSHNRSAIRLVSLIQLRPSRHNFLECQRRLEIRLSQLIAKVHFWIKESVEMKCQMKRETHHLINHCSCLDQLVLPRLLEEKTISLPGMTHLKSKAQAKLVPTKLTTTFHSISLICWSNPYSHPMTKTTLKPLLTFIKEALKAKMKLIWIKKLSSRTIGWGWLMVNATWLNKIAN